MDKLGHRGNFSWEELAVGGPLGGLATLRPPCGLARRRPPQTRLWGEAPDLLCAPSLLWFPSNRLRRVNVGTVTTILDLHVGLIGHHGQRHYNIVFPRRFCHARVRAKNVWGCLTRARRVWGAFAPTRQQRGWGPSNSKITKSAFDKPIL